MSIVLLKSSHRAFNRAWKYGIFLTTVYTLASPGGGARF
jgi:hypothetical protein